MHKKSIILTIASLAIVVALSLGVIGSASADNNQRLPQDRSLQGAYPSLNSCLQASLPGDSCEYDPDACTWFRWREIPTPPPPPTPTSPPVPPPDPNAGVPQSILNSNLGLYPAAVCYVMRDQMPGRACWVRNDGQAYLYNY